MAYLANTGIGTGIHYPVPLHLQKAYEWLGYGVGSFPVAEQVSAEILSLPMFPQLSAQQQRSVVEKIRAFNRAATKETCPACEHTAAGD
jgi:dTDP-4-amino-4,6-dideoxygalactose transaminase